MKAKRIISALLAALMLCGVMCSCKKATSSESSGYYYDVSYITTTTSGSTGTAGNSNVGGSSNQSTASTGTVSGSTGANVTSKVDVTSTGGRFDVDLSGTTIKVLLGYTPSDYEQEIYDQFCAKTGAKIKYISRGNKTRSEKLVALIAANDAPDATVMRTDTTDFPSFITRKLVQPVTSYVKNTDTWLDWDIMNALKYKEDYYAITDTSWGDTLYVYYNKDILENDINVKSTPKQLYEAGTWTWDAFYELAKTLTKKDSSNKITQYGCVLIHKNCFALSAGASLVKYDNGKFTNTINTTAMKDASNMYRKLIKDNYITPVDGDTEWSAGKAAMNIYPQYILRQSLNSTHTKSWAPFNWDVVPFPSYTGGQSYEPLSAECGVIPAKAKNPEAGALLWLYRAYCQANFSTLKNENADMVNLYKKTLSSATYFSLDVGVVGDGAYNDLLDPSASLQTAIDSWSSKIDGKIAEYEKEQTMYNFNAN